MTDDLDLNLLRVFDALVREGSVTGASERLQLSVPATSRALGRLRAAMADPILVRAGRGMVPTPFASRSASRVRSLLDEAAALAGAGRTLVPADLERTFTIRINDGVAAPLATQVVDAVAALAPGVRLRFVPEGEETTDDLRDGTTDLDIGVGEPAASDIHVAELYRERMVGLARAGHPITEHRRPALAHLTRYPHVSASRRGKARGPLDDALAARGLRRHVAVVVPSFAVAAFVVSVNPYLTLVPRRLADLHGAGLGLQHFPIPVDLPDLRVRLFWHSRLENDPAQRWLRDTIRTALT